MVGDLSAILIENVNPLVNLIRVPEKKIALLSDFEEKVEKIARSTMNKNVTNLSGVPSWMLAVVRHIMEIKGTDNLAEVWPNLEVFFHGGVAFTPYREQYKQIIRSDKMHYMETYNASEGFFGLQNDFDDPAMMLMIDYGVFYEFIPMEEIENENPHIIPLADVELNKNYAMVISTSCGLWRYMIGDTVKFTSKYPYKFVITGRTKHFINAFGEEDDVAGRMLMIERLGGILKYNDVADKVFRSNLCMIDLHFPRMLGEMLRVMHLDGISKVSDLIEAIKQINPLKIKDELIHKHSYYEYKMKQFLMALALGMRPAKIFNGIDSAISGFLFVDGNGEILCYQKADRQVFADFLFVNSRFEKSSTEKDKYGYLERENGVYYFKLNLKIGLLKR